MRRLKADLLVAQARGDVVHVDLRALGQQELILFELTDRLTVILTAEKMNDFLRIVLPRR